MNRVSASSMTGASLPRRSPGSTTAPAQFCGHCGGTSDGGLPPSDVHQRCVEQLSLEPPRYCAFCRRRMKVQVTPTGWSAECSRHGLLRQVACPEKSSTSYAGMAEAGLLR